MTVSDTGIIFQKKNFKDKVNAMECLGIGLSKNIDHNKTSITCN